MKGLVLPLRAVIQLTDKSLLPLRLEGILFRLTFFAGRKNDFHLGPFSSDRDGLVTISRREMEAGVSDHYETGLMDYARLSECVPSVEIRLLAQDDIQRAIDVRKMTWTSLLPGERERWNSMEELLDAYKNARNKTLFCDQSPPIRDDWDKAEAEYAYSFVVVPR